MRNYFSFYWLVIAAVSNSFLFSQEQSTVSNFTVCEEIKKLNAQDGEEKYMQVAQQLRDNNLNSCECGFYFLEKKATKAINQMAQENNFSDQVQEQIRTVAQVNSRRAAVEEAVYLSLSKGVELELKDHIVEMVQHAQAERKKRFFSTDSLDAMVEHPENLHVKVKWGRYRIDAANVLSKESQGGIFSEVDVLGVRVYTIYLQPAGNVDFQKGCFNHEFGHYFFGDELTDVFLSKNIFKKDIRDLVDHKNGVQKFFYSTELRADWFLGLIASTSAPFELIKETFTQLQDLPEDTSTHPPVKKRIDWISRWIKLKQAEEKIKQS